MKKIDWKKVFSFWGAFLNILRVFGRKVNLLSDRAILWTKFASGSTTSKLKSLFKKKAKSASVPTGFSSGFSSGVPDEDENRKRFWKTVSISNGIWFLLSTLVFFFVPPIKINGVAIWNWGVVLFLIQLMYSVVYPLLPLYWERGHVVDIEDESGDQKNDEIDFDYENSWKSKKHPILTANTLGAVYFMGGYRFAVPAGFVYLPPFCTLERAPKGIIQFQLPPGNKIWWGDSEKCPPGMYLPLRIAQVGELSDAEKKEQNPLSANMTTEVSLQARMQVNEKELYTFLTVVGSVRYAKQMVTDALVSKTRELLAKLTPLMTLRGFEEVNRNLSEHFSIFVTGWGVKSHDAYIVDHDLGRTVNSALRDIPAKELVAKATILEAQGTKEKKTLEGQGDAAAKEADLMAEAKGLNARGKALKRMKRDLDVTGLEVLQAQTAEQVAEKVKDLSVVGSSIGSAAFGLAKMFDKGAKSNKGGAE